jgi:two-component system NtrC family response regulator
MEQQMTAVPEEVQAQDQKPKLLVVEDDPELRAQMKWALARDYDVAVAENREQALAALRANRPAVLTLDLGLPPDPNGVSEGFNTLNEVLSERTGTKVIIITGREERVHALNAIGQGAYDFFPKPVQIDELQVVLRRAFHIAGLEEEKRTLEREPWSGVFEGIVGNSPKMQQVYATVRKVAPSNASVLIVGESGTGKELIARAIHRQSERRNGPFLTINCGAIPDTLLESELFGHEKGSFTGAHIQRRGRIEMAHGGTLFLDEIGELSVPLQVKLLRFLQERTIERIGGRSALEVDVRVMAATNMDLVQAMKEGRFREDLYYRLAVVNIALPSLRERGDDILILAKTMLQQYIASENKSTLGFTSQALRALVAHSWPGNVRELQNRIKRAVIMAEGVKLTAEDMELSGSYVRHDGSALRNARESLERELIEGVIAKNRGNMSRSAVELGISRSALYERMEKLGVKRARRNEDKE